MDLQGSLIKSLFGYGSLLHSTIDLVLIMVTSIIRIKAKYVSEIEGGGVCPPDMKKG